MADNIKLSDCLVPYDWKKEQDAHEREHGVEVKGSTPLPYPAQQYPRLPLAKAAKLAQEAGMTYGQYMARRGIFPAPPKRKQRTLLDLYADGAARYCERCGERLTSVQRKYCTVCKTEAYAEVKARSKAQMRRELEGY